MVITTLSIDGRVSDMTLKKKKKMVITTLSINGRVSGMMLITENGYYHTVDRWESQ